MYLKKLSLVNFKNHEEGEFAFSEGVNCFVGDNGAGKTNLLDAIYYLSFAKSFFNPTDTQNVRHGSDFLLLQGVYELGGEEQKIHLGIKKGHKKVLKRNGKAYTRLADHIGLLPLVMVSPADSALILGGSDLRRKFVDGVIAQYDRRYLDHLLHYNKALANRNALLKHFAEQRTFDSSSLEIWDVKLAEYAHPVYEGRQAFLDRFIPIFSRYYHDISGGAETVTLEYETRLHDDSMKNLLRNSVDRDRMLRHTSEGIHKDDLVFMLGGHPIKRIGSQGQQKTYLMALKLAQFDLIKEIKGFKPILLFDDVFDKLDRSRVKALMKLVSDHNFGQIFITDTNKDRVHHLFEEIDGKPRVFKIG